MASNLQDHRYEPTSWRRLLPMRSKMGGWIVTVAIFKDDSDEDKELRHATYVVAVNDPAEAVKLSLKDYGAKARMLNRSRKNNCKGQACSPAS